MKLVLHGFLVLVTTSLLSACVSVRDSESLESRVSRLVDQTTKSERTAQKAFDNLESLGNQSVPYLVAHLGDMRPLAAQEISLENKASDAFESERHYGPETVHDALAAILSLVGASLLFITVPRRKSAKKTGANGSNGVDTRSQIKLKLVPGNRAVGWVGFTDPAFAASGWVDGANPAYGTWIGAGGGIQIDLSGRRGGSANLECGESLLQPLDSVVCWRMYAD